MLPHAPEMDTIEVLWRAIKRALAGKISGTLEEMEYVRETFRT